MSMHSLLLSDGGACPGCYIADRQAQATLYQALKRVDMSNGELQHVTDAFNGIWVPIHAAVNHVI